MADGTWLARRWTGADPGVAARRGSDVDRRAGDNRLYMVHYSRLGHWQNDGEGNFSASAFFPNRFGRHVSVGVDCDSIAAVSGFAGALRTRFQIGRWHRRNAGLGLD